MNDKSHVLYIITSFSMGGAQRVLLELLRSDLSRDYPPLLVTLADVPGLEQEFTALNMPVLRLDLKRPWRLPGKLAQLKAWLERYNVRLVYSLMPHANLFAVLLKIRFRTYRLKVVWAMHNTPLQQLYKRLDHRLIMRMMTRLSNMPERIITVSKRSYQRYREMGYPQPKLTLIPNGMKLVSEPAKPCIASCQHLKQKLGIAAHKKIIGSLTRNVPEKDIPNLLAAMQFLVRSHPGVCLLLAGEGMEASNRELTKQLEAYDLQDVVCLLGVRSDARQLIQIMDIAVLSSRSESLPLFMLEAMALRVVCVATDVGDMPMLLEGHGYLVPAGDPAALAGALKKALALNGVERWELLTAAKIHARQHYSVTAMVNRHRVLYQRLLQEG